MSFVVISDPEEAFMYRKSGLLWMRSSRYVPWTNLSVRIVITLPEQEDFMRDGYEYAIYVED